MINPTSPLASSTIISMSLGVTVPSLSAKPSQVADRTNRLASLMPLIEVLSNNSAMVIVLLMFWHSCYFNVITPTHWDQCR
jgi:hypothetical protein